MELILWIIAVILVVAGFIRIAYGELIMGIVFILLGCLVGPGGVSLFT